MVACRTGAGRAAEDALPAVVGCVVVAVGLEGVAIAGLHHGIRQRAARSSGRPFACATRFSATPAVASRNRIDARPGHRARGLARGSLAESRQPHGARTRLTDGRARSGTLALPGFARLPWRVCVRQEKGRPDGRPEGWKRAVDQAALETAMRCVSVAVCVVLGSVTVNSPFFKVALARVRSMSTSSGIWRSKRPCMRSL